MCDTPKDIKFDSVVVDLCFHPQKNVIAAGDIDGDVSVYSYATTEENHLLLSLPHHKKSCRALRFSPSGERLVTTSKDKSIQVVDMDTGGVKYKIKKAHEAALYSLLVVDANIVASGDDDGHFKVWDLRTNKSVMAMKENDEFISDMVIDDSNRVLVASSGDGTLSAFDIRKHKLKLQSELFDSELLSIAKVKGGEKLVCGTGEGAINIFNWGEWGNISDRFPGHPMSVDCIVPVTDSIIVTGSIDGIVRVVNVLPNRFLGVLGEHKGFPIENMTMSHCSKFLATCSHDELIKFWNIDDIDKLKVNARKKAKKSTKTKPLSKAARRDGGFFSDLAGGEGTSKKNDDAASGDEGSDDDGDSSSNSDSDIKSPAGSRTNLSANDEKTNVRTASQKDKNKEDYDCVGSDNDEDDSDLDSDEEDSSIIDNDTHINVNDSSSEDSEDSDDETNDDQDAQE